MGFQVAGDRAASFTNCHCGTPKCAKKGLKSELTFEGHCKVESWDGELIFGPGVLHKSANVLQKFFKIGQKFSKKCPKKVPKTLPKIGQRLIFGRLPKLFLQNIRNFGDYPWPKNQFTISISRSTVTLQSQPRFKALFSHILGSRNDSLLGRCPNCAHWKPHVRTPYGKIWAKSTTPFKSDIACIFFEHPVQ